MGRSLFHLDLPVTDKSKLKGSDGLGLKSGPIDFAVITPRIDLRPRKLGLPRWPLARPASAVTSEF